MKIAQAARAALANDGVITQAEAKDLAKLVKTTEDKVELRNVMGLDNFSSAARADLNKLLGKQAAPEPSAFVGTRLGRTHGGEDVYVTREVGAKQGYDSKEQAMAVARMGGAEPAAVVKGRDGQWHAVETTKNFFGGLESSADNSAVRGVVPMASDAHIAEVAAEVKKLRENGDPNGELDEKLKQLAVLTYGTEDVELTRTSADRKAGRINLNADFSAKHAAKQKAPRGLHGPEGGGDEDFAPGRKSAIEVATNEMFEPKLAQGIVFHEMNHKNDYDLTDKWAQKYVDEGHVWVAGPIGAKPFGEWIEKQVKAKKLTPAEAELIRDMALNMNASTEARSFAKTALAAAQAGNPEVAKDQLVTYAKALARGEYAAPLPGSEVQKALTKELQAAYKQMSPDQKDALKAAVAAARAANKDAWVSKLVFE